MDFLKQIFGEEALTFSQFEEKIKNSDEIELVNAAGGAYVPKSELDEANEKLKNAEDDAKANAEKYKDFDAQLQAAKNEGTDALNAYKRENAITQKLVAANVRDEVSVRANLDLESVALGEDGNLTGLDDQLAGLKTSKPYLFNEPEKLLDLGAPTGGVKNVGEVKGLSAAVAEFYNND